MDYVDQEEDDEDGPEIEMNWNLAKYLPESGACQKNFNTVVAGKKFVKLIYSRYLVG